jgi:hypothetical protein
MKSFTDQAGVRSARLIQGILTAAIAAIVLAGCQSSGRPTAPSSPGQPGQAHTGGAGVSALVRELDSCIHDHGSPNFPDPYVDANGNVAFPANAPNLPAAAQQACQPIIDQLPNPGNGAPTPIAAAVFQQWLHFAACMRAHGLPAWPDPNSDGSFPLPAALQTAPSSTIAPAFQACQYLDPNPNGKYSVSSGAGS